MGLAQKCKVDLIAKSQFMQDNINKRSKLHEMDEEKTFNRNPTHIDD